MAKERFPEEYLGVYGVFFGYTFLFSILGPGRYGIMQGRLEEEPEEIVDLFKVKDRVPVNSASRKFLEGLCDESGFLKST